MFALSNPFCAMEDLARLLTKAYRLDDTGIVNILSANCCSVDKPYIIHCSMSFVFVL